MGQRTDSGTRPRAPYNGDRVELRAWSADDVEAHFATYSNWDVAQWLGATPRPVETRAQSLASIERWAARRDDPFGIWAVVPHEYDDPIGSVLLVPLQDADGLPVEEIEVGWHLHPDHWGRGYATEGARILLDLAWQVGREEVWAVIHPGNARSVRVTERLGMAPDGRTNRWYGVELESFRARPA